MARRKSENRLDRALDLWAAWCVSGGSESAAKSLLARWMDNKGELNFDSSGAPESGPADDLEAGIEVCVLRMFEAFPMRADVLRLEYDAGAGRVIKRREIKGYSPRARQFEKALCLGIGLRTYKLHLSTARQAIEDMLRG